MAGVTIDATALIALMKPTDSHHEWAKDFFIKHLHDELVISSLTYAEVLTHPARHNVLDKFLNDIEALELNVASLSDNDSVPLAQLRVSSGLRMPDAVVLHTAKSLGTSLVTADAQLGKQAQLVGISVHTPE